MSSGRPPALVDVQAVTHTYGRGAAAVTVLHKVTVEIGGGSWWPRTTLG